MYNWIISFYALYKTKLKGYICITGTYMLICIKCLENKPNSLVNFKTMNSGKLQKKLFIINMYNYFQTFKVSYMGGLLQVFRILVNSNK